MRASSDISKAMVLEGKHFAPPPYTKSDSHSQNFKSFPNPQNANHYHTPFVLTINFALAQFLLIRWSFCTSPLLLNLEQSWLQND